MCRPLDILLLLITQLFSILFLLQLYILLFIIYYNLLYMLMEAHINWAHSFSKANFPFFCPSKFLSIRSVGEPNSRKLMFTRTFLLLYVVKKCTHMLCQVVWREANAPHTTGQLLFLNNDTIPSSTSALSQVPYSLL